MAFLYIFLAGIRFEEGKTKRHTCYSDFIHSKSNTISFACYNSGKFFTRSGWQPVLRMGQGLWRPEAGIFYV